MSEVPLFERVLGAEFSDLPGSVQAIHRRSGTRVYAGEVAVRRGRGFLAWCCASAARLPPTRDVGPLQVEIAATVEGECWTRRFGSHRMASNLWFDDGLLGERLGVLRFGFALEVKNSVLTWRVVRVHAAGLPLPALWFSGVVAREFEQDGRYRFEVTARLPILGELIHYAGWLDVG